MPLAWKWLTKPDVGMTIAAPPNIDPRLAKHFKMTINVNKHHARPVGALRRILSSYALIIVEVIN